MIDTPSILITGATKGIGAEIARRFALEGYRILALFRNTDESLNDLRNWLKENTNLEHHFFSFDISKFPNDYELINLLNPYLNSIKVLVNNAGRVERKLLLDIDERSFDDMINTNVKSPFFLSQFLIGYWKNKKASEVSIINIGSLSSFLCRSKMSHYQLSKAALVSTTRSMAFEAAEFGIRVNCISPGLIKSEANREHWESDPVEWERRSYGIPLSRTGMPADIAGLAYFLSTEEASWITGANYIVDGGMSLE